MDVMLVCNFWHFAFEKDSSRYRSMAEILAANENFSVEVVTSSFRHQTKSRRDENRIQKMMFPYKVTLLHEPTYKKNISLRRLYAHKCFSKNILHYLKKRKKPDVIICSVPSLSVGDAVTRFAEKNGIKCIIDIQDLWPEAFKMAFHAPILSDVAFHPLMRQANGIYSRADAIIAVSDTYLARGMQTRTKSCPSLSLYIGTDFQLMKNACAGKKICKPCDEYWIVYAGALGYSYDIKVIIDALALLQNAGGKKIIFKVLGSGVLQQDFENYAKKKNVVCDFMGFLEYGDMMTILSVCDVAVNPIVGRSVSSIINKVSDYAAAGLPVVNTQNSEEYRALIDAYNCGVNCQNSDPQSVADAILCIYQNEHLREQMSKNALQMAVEKFDRAKTYGAVSDLIYTVTNHGVST